MAAAASSVGSFPGVYTQAEEHALRTIIREEVAALASAGQPTRSSDAVWYQMEAGQIVSFMIGGNVIEIGRLLNIFENTEMHAGFIYDHLRRESEPVSDDVAHQKALVSNRHSAMRKAVTIRDCFNQLAKLLRGEDLDDPDFAKAKRTRAVIDLDPDEEITGASRG